MPAAYAAADVIVSRAGAGTLSELCLIGKPAILIPSPNVAEDHQTHNAKALSEKGAAVIIAENELDERFIVFFSADYGFRSFGLSRGLNNVYKGQAY